MEQFYELPLDAIVEMMRGSSHCVILQASLAVPQLTQEECRATVTVGQGKITSCHIMTRGGSALKAGNDAYELLQRIGTVTWSLRPVAPAPAEVFTQAEPVPRQLSPPVSVTNQSWCPRRSVPALTLDQRESLSHAHRHVFALADGTKTVERIAQLLHKSPDDVLRLLLELQMIHLIHATI